MYAVLRGHKGFKEWINYVLRPRTFDIKVDWRVLGRTPMVGVTPQGSPISPNPIHDLHVCGGLESRKNTRGEGRTTGNGNERGLRTSQRC